MAADDYKKSDLPGEVGKKAVRRMKARKERDRSVWFGIGMFGVVGWTVAATTIIGIVIGIWLDSRYENSYSWTLTFMFIGLLIGCFNAWYWIKKETSTDNEDDTGDDNREGG